MDSLTDLICRYQETRDPADAEKIIETIGPDLSRYIRSRIAPNSAKRDAWEDAFQETLVAIVRGLPSFHIGNADTFLSYCYAIARNKVADQFRGTKTEMNTFVDPELLREALAGLKDKTMSAESWADLNAAIALLKKNDPPCLEYLWNRYFVGLSFALLGEEYGITEDAATKRVRRCLSLARGLTED